MPSWCEIASLRGHWVPNRQFNECYFNATQHNATQIASIAISPQPQLIQGQFNSNLTSRRGHLVSWLDQVARMVTHFLNQTLHHRNKRVTEAADG